MKGFIEQNHVAKEPVQWKRFYDAADAHVINSDVPLGVLEYDGDSDTYHYLFVNKKQMEQLRSIGRRSRDESEFILNSSHFPMHEKFRALTENAVSVTAAPADSLLIVAAFDASGRYKAAYTCAVTYDAAISFEQSGLVLESSDTVKAFLFGKDSITPLCEAKEIAVLTE